MKLTNLMELGYRATEWSEVYRYCVITKAGRPTFYAVFPVAQHSKDAFALLQMEKATTRRLVDDLYNYELLMEPTESDINSAIARK